MAIDNEKYEKFYNSGWVIDTQGDDVPDEIGEFTLILKEGAPEHIKKEYEEWKAVHEFFSERDEDGNLLRV